MDKITIENNEKYLRSISEDVDLGDKSYIDEIKLLSDYCMKNDLFALAAIQVGIPKRLIFLRNTNLDKIEDNEWNEERVLINPVIIKREGLTKYWEACASCLDNMGLISRPYKIKVEYYNIEGNKRIEIFRGFESTVLAHECDHLDGILHMDIAEELIVMEREERKEFRKKNGYKIIAKKGDYSELLEENRK